MALFPPVFPWDAEPPAVTDRNAGHWLDEGRALLRSTARPLRLADAAKERRLTPAQSRRLLHGIVDAVRSPVAATTQALIDGAQRLAGWFRSVLGLILPGHFAGAMSLLNTQDPAPADLAAITAAANRQAAFLARFRDQLKSGDQLLDGTARSRAEMYGHAVWSVAQGVLRRRMDRDGLTSERRVLGALDSCADCLDQAALKWQPIGTLADIGDSVCRTNCKCHFEYR
jgi:hypothetical protein